MRTQRLLERFEDAECDDIYCYASIAADELNEALSDNMEHAFGNIKDVWDATDKGAKIAIVSMVFLNGLLYLNALSNSGLKKIRDIKHGNYEEHLKNIIKQAIPNIKDRILFFIDVKTTPKMMLYTAKLNKTVNLEDRALIIKDMVNHLFQRLSPKNVGRLKTILTLMEKDQILPEGARSPIFYQK